MSMDENFLIAQDYDDEGRFLEAAALWESLGPDCPDALYNAGNTYLNLGHRKRAGRLLKAAAELGVMEAYLNLGLLLAEKHPKRALRYLFASAAHDDPHGYVAAAIILGELGRKAESLHLLDVACRREIVGASAAKAVVLFDGGAPISERECREILTLIELEPREHPDLDGIRASVEGRLATFGK